MTIQLLSVLAAAGLVASGLGTTSETRSAQSLPAHNLAVAQTPGAISGKLRTVNRLQDAPPADQSGESDCKRTGGTWDADHQRCRRGAWWLSTPALLIAGATVAGVIIAVTETNHHNSVSN